MLVTREKGGGGESSDYKSNKELELFVEDSVLNIGLWLWRNLENNARPSLH
jgi:hypothetical protein